MNVSELELIPHGDVDDIFYSFRFPFGSQVKWHITSVSDLDLLMQTATVWVYERGG